MYRHDSHLLQTQYPRKPTSIVRKVQFDTLNHSRPRMNELNALELYWLSYSLAMPVYEKSVASLDTFVDNYVMQQEFEHSRVHAKLNQTYTYHSSQCSRIAMHLCKAMWRVYFKMIMASPGRDLMIICELVLQNHCFDCNERLTLLKNATMSSAMKKVIVYHDLEEMEHGLDLMPLITSFPTWWKCILLCFYSIHSVVFSILIDLQVFIMQLAISPKKAFSRAFRKTKFYLSDILSDINPRVIFSVLTNRYASKEFRTQQENLYKNLALELHDLDLYTSSVVI